MIEVFSFPPDFTVLPKFRATVAPDIISLSAAEAFVAWPDERDETVVTMTFAGENHADKIAFVAFWERMAGRNRPFMMPSWHSDFLITNAPGIGATELILSASDGLPAFEAIDRPGAALFVFDPDNGFFSARVLRKTGTTYDIDEPLTFAPSSKAIAGWMRAARFDLDEITPNFADEDHFRCEVAIKTLRLAVELDRTVPVSSGANFRLWKASTEAVQSLALPNRTRFDFASCIGPATYGEIGTLVPTTVADDAEYAKMNSQWYAWIGADGVYFAKTEELDIWTVLDASGTKSALLRHVPERLTHLAFCFDGDGREVLALEDESREWITLYGYIADDPFRFGFDGLSPQLFEFWTLPSEAFDNIEAEVVVVYLKPGRAAIYGRFESDDFEIERVLTETPNVPIKIEAVTVSGDTLRVECIDDGLRSMVLAADYSYATILATTIHDDRGTIQIMTDTLRDTLYVGAEIHTILNTTSTQTLRDSGTWTLTETETWTLTNVVGTVPVAIGETIIETSDGMGGTVFDTNTIFTDSLVTTPETVIVVMPTTVSIPAYTSTEIILESLETIIASTMIPTLVETIATEYISGTIETIYETSQ